MRCRSRLGLLALIGLIAADLPAGAERGQATREIPGRDASTILAPDDHAVRTASCVRPDFRGEESSLSVGDIGSLLRCAPDTPGRVSALQQLAAEAVRSAHIMNNKSGGLSAVNRRRLISEGRVVQGILAASMHHCDPEVRREVAGVIARAGFPWAVSCIRSALVDGRLRAVDALPLFVGPGADAVASIIGWYLFSEEPEERMAAVQASAGVVALRSIVVAMAMDEREPESVRILATRVSGGESSFVPYLIRIAEDQSVSVELRDAALSAIVSTVELVPDALSMWRIRVLLLRLEALDEARVGSGLWHQRLIELATHGGLPVGDSQQHGAATQ